MSNPVLQDYPANVDTILILPESVLPLPGKIQTETVREE
jgi:hypothetical protein